MSSEDVGDGPPEPDYGRAHDVGLHFAADVLRFGIERACDEWIERPEIVDVVRDERSVTTVEIQTITATFRIDLLSGMRVATVTPDAPAPTAPGDDPLERLARDLGFGQDLLAGLQQERAEVIADVLAVARQYEAGDLPAVRLVNVNPRSIGRVPAPKTPTILDVASGALRLVAIDDAISELG